MYKRLPLLLVAVAVLGFIGSVIAQLTSPSAPARPVEFRATNLGGAVALGQASTVRFSEPLPAQASQPADPIQLSVFVDPRSPAGYMARRMSRVIAYAYAEEIRVERQVVARCRSCCR